MSAAISIGSLKVHLVAVLFAVFSTISPNDAWSTELGPVNKNWRSIAIKGYDPVAYFTLSKPVKGSRKHEYRWRNARWRFASEEHKDLFVENPERYAPRFGGFCTGGLSLGQKGSIDPAAWIIVENRLYLAYEKKARDFIVENFDKVIEQAEANWEKLNKQQE